MISWKENVYTVTINGKQCASQTVPTASLEALKAGSFAIKAGTYGEDTTDIYFKDVQIKNSKGEVVVEKGTDTWEVSTGNGETIEEGADLGLDGYNSITISEGDNKCIIGQADLTITKDNIDDYDF